MPFEPEFPDPETRKRYEDRKRKVAVRSAVTWAMLNAVGGAFFAAAHVASLAVFCWVGVAVEVVRLLVLTWDHKEDQ